MTKKGGTGGTQRALDDRKVLGGRKRADITPHQSTKFKCSRKVFRRYWKMRLRRKIFSEDSEKRGVIEEDDRCAMANR